jgi:hypothetical protein
MSVQTDLILVTPIIPGKYKELSASLEQIRQGLSSGSFKEFEKIDTLHYARWVLLENQLSNGVPNLVFNSDYDGDENEHLTLLSTAWGDLLDNLYGCCEGYPTANDRTTESRKNYLKKWRNTSEAFYIGARSRSLKQIKQESSLRNAIWDYLHKNKFDGKTAAQIHTQIREYIATLPEFAWSNEKIQLPQVKWWNFILVVGVLLLLLPVVLPVVLIWLLVVHFFYEKKDKPLGLPPSKINDQLISTLEGYEDHINQNQFTQIVAMKPGMVRFITIKAILLYGKFRILNEFVKGELMGIPTIHFAQWVLIDNNKQVLFFSNFDGSWQQYLGDFIDKSGWGLTAIFSNTADFPETRWLFWGGAYDEEHFLAWARYTNVPSQVWYSAYPKLSIKNINTNTIIRHELIKTDLSEEQAQTFLNRF